MAKIAEIIKYEGDNSTFIWKHPAEDFNSLTQLIVHESQEAVFFMNGQALDLFGPGRYTLKTQNIPVLGKLLNKTTGDESPFHCEVYFINKTVQMSLLWGTDTKVRFIDPTMGVPFEIGASGKMNLAVCDSRKLLIKLVGTMNGVAWGERGTGFTQSLENSFRPLILTAVKSHLASAIKSENINIVEIDEHLERLSATLQSAINPGFEEYGLTIPQFYITNVVLPEGDKNFQNLKQLHAQSFQAKFIKAQREIALEQEETQAAIDRRRAEAAAEQKLIGASADAQADKMKGFAEAEVMAAKGYNEKDVIQADVQKAYAAGIGNMNISGGGGGAGDIVGLATGLAAAGAIAPQVGEMFSGMTGIGGNAQQTAAATIKCSNCGADLPESAKFCFECGEKVVPAGHIVCPECGNTVIKGKFCPECGHKFALNCPKCNAEIASGTKFCPECGEKL